MDKDSDQWEKLSPKQAPQLYSQYQQWKLSQGPEFQAWNKSPTGALV